MHIRTVAEALRNPRGGQVSYLLLGPGDFDSRHLAVTWVEGAPGSRQASHAHPDREQVYVIVQGQGRMSVGDESALVNAGTMILVPPGAPHAIENIADGPLVYVSATAPPFALPEPGSAFAYS